MDNKLITLFTKFISNACSREEYEEFLRLIESEEKDELLKTLITRYFAEDHQHIQRNGFIDNAGQLQMKERFEDFHWKPVKTRKYQIFNLSVAAAIVAMIFLIPLFFDGGHKKTLLVSAIAKKSTARSETKFIVLSDSTKVWLNAASILEFPDVFDERKREVTLVGEAFFDVKHAEKLPFIIHTGGIVTTVLGTSFNIKAYPSQSGITVSVTRGKVKVGTSDGYENTLIKGDQLTISNNNEGAIEKQVSVEKIASWQQGDLFYDDAALSDILDDLINIHGAEIIFNSATLKNIRLTAAFQRKLPVEKVLAIISKLTGVSVTKKSENFYIIDQNY